MFEFGKSQALEEEDSLPLVEEAQEGEATISVNTQAQAAQVLPLPPIEEEEPQAPKKPQDAADSKEEKEEADDDAVAEQKEVPTPDSTTTTTTTTTQSLLLLDILSARQTTVSAFERVDDVVMGGVSSSKLIASKDMPKLVWTGQVRVDGGGFTGVRTRRFNSPLDLSSYDGLVFDTNLESDDEPERRTWKVTVRTQDSRGEMVYQAPFMPNTPTEIPWSAFRLVRGPVAVPNVPPLGDEPEKLKEIYGVGIIMSRFGAAGPMENFRDGYFRLAINDVGCYSNDSSSTSPPTAFISDLASAEDSTNRGNRTFVGVLLAPLLKVLFNEKRRRRAQARRLLKRRYGMSELKARFVFGHKLKTNRLGAPSAVTQGVAELAADLLAILVAIPVRLLFKTQGVVFRAIRKLRGEKPLPKMA